MGSNIFQKAYEGTLIAADLPGGVKGEIDFIDPNTKLTPLGAAVWFGRVDQVQLLLRKGANPDGPAEARPPLWVAASKTKRNAGQIVHMLLNKNANPSRRSVIDDNSTPLLAAVKTRKPPALISALVDAGASPLGANNKGETAQKVAEDRKDRGCLQALLPFKDRLKERAPAVLQLTGLMLFVVAWANKNVKVATAGGGAIAASFAIKKRFSFSGLFDGVIPSWLKEERPKDQFKKDVSDYVKRANLDKFFPPGSRFLKDVVDRALELDANPQNTLDVHDLTRIALYQPVLYCDDSGSMRRESRREHQNQLVQRITSITTRIVPDDEGIDLRFINAPTSVDMTRPTIQTIDKIMNGLPINGWTEIGTNLRQKVLEDLVYTSLRNGTFRRPVLVSIITDGHPGGPAGSSEMPDSLKDAILECGRELRDHGYHPKVVRFQISQIGSDSSAAEFLDALDADPELSEVVYRTAEKLDDEFQSLRDNEARLEQWLLTLLMGPITDADVS